MKKVLLITALFFGFCSTSFTQVSNVDWEYQVETWCDEGTDFVKIYALRFNNANGYELVATKDLNNNDYTPSGNETRGYCDEPLANLLRPCAAPDFCDQQFCFAGISQCDSTLFTNDVQFDSIRLNNVLYTPPSAIVWDNVGDPLGIAFQDSIEAYLQSVLPPFQFLVQSVNWGYNPIGNNSTATLFIGLLDSSIDLEGDSAYYTSKGTDKVALDVFESGDCQSCNTIYQSDIVTDVGSFDTLVWVEQDGNRRQLPWNAHIAETDSIRAWLASACFDQNNPLSFYDYLGTASTVQFDLSFTNQSPTVVYALSDGASLLIDTIELAPAFTYGFQEPNPYDTLGVNVWLRSCPADTATVRVDEWEIVEVCDGVSVTSTFSASATIVGVDRVTLTNTSVVDPNDLAYINFFDSGIGFYTQGNSVTYDYSNTPDGTYMIQMRTETFNGSVFSIFGSVTVSVGTVTAASWNGSNVVTYQADYGNYFQVRAKDGSILGSYDGEGNPYTPIGSPFGECQPKVRAVVPFSNLYQN